MLEASIRFAGTSQLITGSDPDEISDEAGLTDFVGTWTTVAAGLVAGMTVLEHWEPLGDPWTDVAELGLVGLIFVVAGWMIIGARRFEARD